VSRGRSRPRWECWRERRQRLGALPRECPASPARVAVHRFKYSVCLWLLDLDELPALRLAGSASTGRARLRSTIAIISAGAPSPSAPNCAASSRASVRSGPAAPSACSRNAASSVRVQPRQLLVLPQARRLARDVVAEVNNTFGERHCYVSPSRRQRGRPARLPSRSTGTTRRCSTYRRSSRSTGRMPSPSRHPANGCGAHHPPRRERAADRHRAGAGARAADGDERLARAGRYPFMTARVIGAIHWEAARLWWKGARYRDKPVYDPRPPGTGEREATRDESRSAI